MIQLPQIEEVELRWLSAARRGLSPSKEPGEVTAYASSTNAGVFAHRRPGLVFLVRCFGAEINLWLAQGRDLLMDVSSQHINHFAVLLDAELGRDKWPSLRGPI